MSENPCPDCHGQRLRPEVLAVTVGGMNIADFTDMPIKAALAFIEALPPMLSEMEHMIADSIIKEIRSRMTFLRSVGLEYLPMSRQAGSLSGGEAQRIRLATQIGSSLMGVLYILDEPSIGLHQRDNAKLLDTLKRLRDLGNTLLVVEHDEDTMRESDFIVDIGPGAGVSGGHVVCAGTAEEIMACGESVTGQYLSGRKKIPVPETRRKGSGRMLTVRGAAENNLKHIDVSFPLGVMTCVTGVSGSGKSSLVNEVVYKKLAAELNRAKVHAGRHDSFEGSGSWIRLSASISPPSGGRPAPTPPPIRAFSTTSGICSPPPRTPKPGATVGQVFLQYPGRPLRGVRRRRAFEDRNALPAGHLCPVRGLRRKAIQPGDAGGAL
jgi:excinuclease ABC subunit A